jgi:hypothetical protein
MGRRYRSPARPRQSVPRRGLSPTARQVEQGNSPSSGPVETGEMRRHALALVSAPLVIAAGCGALQDERVASSSMPRAGSSSPPVVASEGFLPATYVEGDRIVMPVTFPDGTTAELVYPPELDLPSLRVQPYSSGYGPGFARDFLVYDEPLEEVIGSYEDAELLSEYDDGRGGTVGFWRLPPDGVYLAFQFGSWTVLVYDYEGASQMSDEDRALWATNLHGRDAEDGFLLLEADPR